MHRITKVGILSLAKVMGMSGFLVGLIAGVIWGGVLILLGLAGVAGQEEGAAGIAAFGVGGGLMVMIMVPIFYAVASFIGGLIYGFIINIVLGLAGGLELEIHPPA